MVPLRESIARFVFPPTNPRELARQRPHRSEVLKGRSREPTCRVARWGIGRPARRHLAILIAPFALWAEGLGSRALEIFSEA